MKQEDFWRSSAPYVCRSISVQGICIAVVPLFIFNDKRKKEVIAACLTQSSPCFWVFELFEIKASGNAVFSDSRVHPRPDQKLFCPGHSAVSIWQQIPAEPSPVQRNMAVTNSTASTKTWSKSGVRCFLFVFCVRLTAQSDRDCFTFPLTSWLISPYLKIPVWMLLDLRMRHQNGARLRNWLIFFLAIFFLAIYFLFSFVPQGKLT